MGLPVKYLPLPEIATLVHAAGFRDEQAATAIAVILGESGGNAYAVNLNVRAPTSRAYLSLDLGLCQWNSHFSPTFTPQQAFDPKQSIDRMFQYHARYGFRLWSAYNSGRYQVFMPRAWDAVAADMITNR